jgi:uncharacterized membrane protein
MMDDRVVGYGRVQMHDNTNWSSESVVDLIIRLTVVAVFVWAVVVLVSQLVKHLNSKASTDELSPIDIAKRRLATGEITAAQFDELKKELK